MSGKLWDIPEHASNFNLTKGAWQLILEKIKPKPKLWSHYNQFDSPFQGFKII